MKLRARSFAPSVDLQISPSGPPAMEVPGHAAAGEVEGRYSVWRLGGIHQQSVARLGRRSEDVGELLPRLPAIRRAGEPRVARVAPQVWHDGRHVTRSGVPWGWGHDLGDLGAFSSRPIVWKALAHRWTSKTPSPHPTLFGCGLPGDHRRGGCRGRGLGRWAIVADGDAREVVEDGPSQVVPAFSDRTPPRSRGQETRRKVTLPRSIGPHRAMLHGAGCSAQVNWWTWP